MPMPKGFASRFGMGSPSAWTVAQLQSYVDARVTERLGTITSRQTTYLGTNGRYWQGLATHAAVPAHRLNAEGDAVSDRYTSKPTDQAETWQAVFPEWAAERFAASLTSDVYDGPQGKGYTLTASVRHEGVTYRRAWNTGPEAWRAHGWQAVTGGPG
jgi:hypothetical protein